MVGGIICLLVGILLLYLMIRSPFKDLEFSDSANFKGYAAAILFIIIGIVMLVDALG